MASERCDGLIPTWDLPASSKLSQTIFIEFRLMTSLWKATKEFFFVVTCTWLQSQIHWTISASFASPFEPISCCHCLDSSALSFSFMEKPFSIRRLFQIIKSKIVKSSPTVDNINSPPKGLRNRQATPTSFDKANFSSAFRHPHRRLYVFYLALWRFYVVRMPSARKRLHYITEMLSAGWV